MRATLYMNIIHNSVMCGWVYVCVRRRSYDLLCPIAESEFKNEHWTESPPSKDMCAAQLCLALVWLCRHACLPECARVRWVYIYACVSVLVPVCTLCTRSHCNHTYALCNVIGAHDFKIHQFLCARAWMLLINSHTAGELFIYRLFEMIN